jgi:hypothetical protein
MVTAIQRLDQVSIGVLLLFCGRVGCQAGGKNSAMCTKLVAWVALWGGFTVNKATGEVAVNEGHYKRILLTDESQKFF